MTSKMALHSFLTVLVLIPIFYGVTVESTAICNNAGMTDGARNAFLNSHNKYRSTVAKGQGYNGDIGYTPAAVNMQKMTYDCAAEAGAIAHAQTCSFKESNPNTRRGYGENVIEISKLYLTLPQVARQATERWWREMTKYGINNNMFYDFTIDGQNKVKRATQMLWNTSNKLGCAINRCTKYFFVVCRYSPRGNIVNNFIYNFGQACGGCPAGTMCDAQTSLCG